MYNKLTTSSFKQRYILFLIIVMSVQYVPVESYTISFVKVGVMIFSLYVLLFRAFYFSKAFVVSTIYWLTCFLVASSHDHMRFSTLGYLGLFLITYVVLYNFVYAGAITLLDFKKLIKRVIVAYTIILVVQQLFVVAGMYYMPLINLDVGNGLETYQWNRLPALSCEPSHSARIITALIIGYIRCLELENNNNKISLKTLFSRRNYLVPACYLYLILFMGSGTGWLGMGIVCIYFIRWRNLYYIIPIFFVSISILMYSGSTQFNRAKTAVEVTLSGNVDDITDADQSASIRIVPLINTVLNLDLTKTESWIGNGTLSEDDIESSWKDLGRKIPVIEQYGILGFFASLLLIYLCVIRKFFSIETLFFIILLLCSVSNTYVTWSPLYIFTIVKYFQDTFLNQRTRAFFVQ